MSFMQRNGAQPVAMAIRPGRTIVGHTEATSGAKEKSQRLQLRLHGLEHALCSLREHAAARLPKSQVSDDIDRTSCWPLNALKYNAHSKFFLTLWGVGEWGSGSGEKGRRECVRVRRQGGLKPLLGLREHDRDQRAPVDRGLALEHAVLHAQELQGRDTISQLDLGALAAAALVSISSTEHSLSAYIWAGEAWSKAMVGWPVLSSCM